MSMKWRNVPLLPDLDQKLARYAKARHMSPEAAAAEAIGAHLREHADISIRIADARATLDKQRDR